VDALLPVEVVNILLFIIYHCEKKQSNTKGVEKVGLALWTHETKQLKKRACV